MKLYEIKHLYEGKVDPNFKMSIENIIRRGSANNTFEFIALARIIQMQVDGSLYASGNYLDSNLSTSKELLDTLRALPADKMMILAAQLLNVLNSIDSGNAVCCTAPAIASKSYAEYIDLCTRKEAND